MALLSGGPLPETGEETVYQIVYGHVQIPGPRVSGNLVSLYHIFSTQLILRGRKYIL